MKTETGIFLTIAVGITAWLFGRRKCKATADGEVSLANIRKGIKNGWYSAQLLEMDGKWYVQLSGTKTDGTQDVGVYEITQATFDALKSDGVQQLV